MRTRARLTLRAALVACVSLITGCGAAGHPPTGPRGSPVSQAPCVGAAAARPLTADTLGVYRAGAVPFPPCPRRQSIARALPAASFPYLGIRCRVANWAGCDRVGVGVHLARPAIRVTVRVDGRVITLSPPTDPGSDLWQGVLLGLGPHRGPLAVRAHHGYWYGEPPVRPRVRVTAYFTDGTAAARAGLGYLHAGYG